MSIGIKIFSSIIRNNQEVAKIVNSDPFDFNYQQFTYLDKPVELKKVCY
jgi:hypothetical protein